MRMMRLMKMAAEGVDLATQINSADSKSYGFGPILAGFVQGPSLTYG